MIPFSPATLVSQSRFDLWAPCCERDGEEKERDNYTKERTARFFTHLSLPSLIFGVFSCGQDFNGIVVSFVFFVGREEDPQKIEIPLFLPEKILGCLVFAQN